MQKLLRAWLAVVLLTTMGLVGCYNSDEQPEVSTESVRLYEVLPSLLYAPQYVAVTQAIFAAEGLEVEIHNTASIEELIKALQEGRADIAVTAAGNSITAYQAGQADQLINFSQLTQREGSFLLSRPGEADFQWQELKGKKVMLGYPGRQAMFLRYILLQQGLEPGKDVQLDINLFATQAFLMGNSDYVLLGEPATTQLEKQAAGYTLISLGTAIGDIPDQVYMARKSYLEKNPASVQKFCNAIYQAQLWADSHSPAETALALGPFFPNEELSDLAAAIERYQQQNTWRVSSVMDEASFDYLEEIMQSTGELEARVEPHLLINNDFAKKAVLFNDPKR